MSAALVPDQVDELQVRIVQLAPRGLRALPLPAYQTALSSGMDLHADLAIPVTLAPHQRALIPSGIAIQIPPGFEGQVRPRSGLSVRHGITLINAPGTIDADYIGEIHMPIINLGEEPFTIEPGQRVAQLVIAPVTRVRWTLAQSLAPTQRGAGGFGHTGR